MSNQWFRLYHEFATDPKVQTMSETLQRRFIMFLCLQCRGDFDTLSAAEKSFSLRITEQELCETIEIFTGKGFIDADGKISNWNKRQFVSDTSTERVRKHRETKKKRKGNVSVTPPDTDTDTDTEREKPARKVASKRCPEEFVPDRQFAIGVIPGLDVDAEFAKFRDCEFKTPKKDWPATWRNWIRSAAESGKYARAKGAARGFQC